MEKAKKRQKAKKVISYSFGDELMKDFQPEVDNLKMIILLNALRVFWN